MSEGRRVSVQAGRMLAAVLICYALVLQALFGSLASASPLGNANPAFMSIICHTQDDEGQSDPLKQVHARHHCVLCQTGIAQAALPPSAPEAALSLLDRRAAIVLYARRQDPATAPLYLPPRVSRGPPSAS